MNKVALLIAFVAVSIFAAAQDKKDAEPSTGFTTEKMFAGGSIGLGLGGWDGGFNIGANPEVGYSVARWLDAGVSTNINYYSFRAEVNNGIRQRSTNYGVGVFTRVYPIRSVFLQVLPEYNWLRTNLKDLRPGVTGDELKLRDEAPSLLLGIGYGTRDIGSSSFYTILMMDVGSNKNSPYIDSYGSKLPILRTGFNFYFARRNR